MRILKIAANFMDSAMNNERFNMGEVVGEMMEPFLIQISHRYFIGGGIICSPSVIGLNSNKKLRKCHTFFL